MSQKNFEQFILEGWEILESPELNSILPQENFLINSEQFSEKFDFNDSSAIFDCFFPDDVWNLLKEILNNRTKIKNSANNNRYTPNVSTFNFNFFKIF